MDEFRLGMLLSHLVEAMAINAEIEAMKALNVYRESRGETIGYDEAAFREKANDLRHLSQVIQGQVF